MQLGVSASHAAEKVEQQMQDLQKDLDAKLHIAQAKFIQEVKGLGTDQHPPR